jgi:hypothetical protein
VTSALGHAISSPILPLPGCGATGFGSPDGARYLTLQRASTGTLLGVIVEE